MTRLPRPPTPETPVPLYKATRPDGTDFHGGTVDYGAALHSGQVIVHPQRRMDRNDPGTYLSAASVPMSAPNASQWPCRLFEMQNVHPSRVIAGFPHDRHWRANTRLRVLRELDSALVFGPNGQNTLRVMDEINALSQDGLQEAERTRNRLKTTRAWKDADAQATRQDGRSNACQIAWTSVLMRALKRDQPCPPDCTYDAIVASVYRDQLNAASLQTLTEALNTGQTFDRHRAGTSH